MGSVSLFHDTTAARTSTKLSFVYRSCVRYSSIFERHLHITFNSAQQCVASSAWRLCTQSLQVTKTDEALSLSLLFPLLYKVTLQRI